MARPAPTHTEHLVLRPVAIEDEAAVLQYRGDKLGGEVTPSRRLVAWPITPIQ